MVFFSLIILFSKFRHWATTYHGLHIVPIAQVPLVPLPIAGQVWFCANLHINLKKSCVQNYLSSVVPPLAGLQCLVGLLLINHAFQWCVCKTTSGHLKIC
jgi:hypothetical protein